MRPAITVIDIVERLPDPAGYVQGVLRNCRECVDDHQRDTTISRDGRQRAIANLVQVRIGTSKHSPAPNYRIERGWLIDGESSAARVYRICGGRTHNQAMEWTDAIVNERWSEETCSMAEIEALWSKLRPANEC